MEIHQYYLNCLAQASYMVWHAGEACVIDPLRDVERYLEDAEARGVRITAVALTHVHADFVSGQCELAERTGARVYVSHSAGAGYEHVAVRDGDELPLGPEDALGGGARLVFLETPGHTPDSICILAVEGEESRPRAVFTGDTLFIGGAGRPDLVVSRGRTPEEMAALHYSSLHEKLLPLPDAVIVYPGHGPGSACGKGMSSETFATLGAQRHVNPALADITREQFVREATAGLPPAPAYFPHSVATNRTGATALAELPVAQALAPDAFETRAAAGAVVIDVRSAAEFGAGHLPGALNIGLDGMFASWCGSLVPVDAELLLVVPDGIEPEVAGAGRTTAEEAQLRLARVGLDQVVGWLVGGVYAWHASGRAVGTTAQMEVSELAAGLDAEPRQRVLDVRRPGEWEDGCLPGAERVTLAELEARAGEIAPGSAEGPLAVICAAGYRSSTACSILARAGHEHLINVRGGMGACADAELPLG